MRLVLGVGLAALAGCAQINYADGERVSLLHDNMLKPADIQEQANAACVQSGGKAPAVLITDIPVTNVLPALAQRTATYRCSR